MKLRSLLISLAILNVVAIVSPKPAHAGTAAYYSECSFIDKEVDDGGDVYKMPCYIVEGANVYSSFFYILWKDGTYTLMSVNLDTGHTVGIFSPLVYRELYQNPTGDLIQIGDLRYTNDRFDITERGIANEIF